VRASSVRRRFSGFLVQYGLDAGHVPADGTHAGCVLKLAGGLLAKLNPLAAAF
jgi:hypothetical protein